MPISFVFFDMMGTLVHFAPEPADLLVEAAAAEDIDLTPQDAHRGFVTAIEWWNRQVALRTSGSFSRDDLEAMYATFDAAVLQKAGLYLDHTIGRRLMDVTMARSGNATMALYADALPALDALRERGVRLGVVTNIGRELPAIIDGLGLAGYFEVLATPASAGATKPDPRIFEWGVKQAHVRKNQAAHVGDQVENDVLGARTAGLLPVLVDRYQLIEGEPDYVKVASLTDVAGLLGASQLSF